MMKYGEMARLSDLASAEIARLQAEGIDPTPAEVVRLNAIAYIIEHPSSRLELSRGRPVFVGGATLWPMTLYAADWYSRNAHLFASDKENIRALAYAMAHGRGDQLDFEESQITRRVDAWARSLRCRNEELTEAVSQCIAQDEPLQQSIDGDEPSVSYGDISAELVALLGGRSEWWEKQVTIPYALEVLSTARAQNDESGLAARNDPRMRAERAMAAMFYKIFQRHKKEQLDGEA